MVAWSPPLTGRAPSRRRPPPGSSIPPGEDLPHLGLGGAHGVLGALLATRGSREHRRDDAALHRLVDGRRDVAWMARRGAPAIGVGEERVPVRRRRRPRP